jgi:hypothetical protein
MRHENFDQCSPPLSIRRADRLERVLVAKVRSPELGEVDVRIDNLSPRGFRMGLVPGLGERAFVHLAISGDLSIAAQVRWLDQTHAGCEFPKGLTSRQYLLLLGFQGEPAAMAPTSLLSRLGRLFHRQRQ